MSVKFQDYYETLGVARTASDEEIKLADAHSQLLEASRQAGMAEVATGVLHNGGNVLNSVNVSATLVADQMRHSQAGRVGSLTMHSDGPGTGATFTLELPVNPGAAHP